MSAYSEFFLSTPQAIVMLELLELSHPSFTQSYFLARNCRKEGVTVTHEDASSHVYTYMPLQIKPLGSQSDMDQEIEITIGDVGEVLPLEIEAVANANGFEVKPTAKYRAYRSDDLTAPIFGPVSLRVDGLSFNKQGAAFRAKAAAFNVVRTGELYRIERFPTLDPLS
jgi:uncharacterized protein DUF1833